MKVLNLQCAHEHAFEGWFGSEDDFASQLARGLLTCPLCGDAHIHKLLSAPRLNLRAGRHSADAHAAPDAEDTAAPVSHPTAHPELSALQARVLRALREVVAHTEDVGENFPGVARAMHHGEVQRRGIRGQASPEEALAMLEEGIEVIALPMVPAIKETLQ